MKRESSCQVCCGAGGGIAAMALLLWFGIPAVVRVLSSLGLRIATIDPWLVPLIVAALGLVMVGLWLSLKLHGRTEPLMLGLAGSVATVVGVLAWSPVALLGFATVAGAILWNQRLLRHKAGFEATP